MIFSLDDFIKENRIYCVIKDSSGGIVLGISVVGVFVFMVDFCFKIYINWNNGL